MNDGDPTWIQVVIVGLGVVQTVWLAQIASRSRRIRKSDQTTDD